MLKAASAALCVALCSAAPGAAEPARRTAADLMDVLMWNREPVGGSFALIDQTGRARTEADFRGKLLIVSFGYTGCPDVCPTDLMEIARALTLLGTEAEAVQPLFITLDPERDTVAQLAEYVPSFHPRLIGLTGDPAAIRKVTDAYKVFAEASVGANGERRIDHSAFIYLMDRSGTYLGFFPPATSAERMLTIIRPHLLRTAR